MGVQGRTRQGFGERSQGWPATADQSSERYRKRLPGQQIVCRRKSGPAKPVTMVGGMVEELRDRCSVGTSVTGQRILVHSSEQWKSFAVHFD